MLASALATPACGPPSANSPEAKPATGPIQPPPQLATERVETIEPTGAPRLQIVRREGDPHGAVAVSVFTEGGSSAAVALGALLYFRLREQGFDVEIRPHAAGSVLVTNAATGARAAEFARAARKALATPVNVKDPGWMLARKWVADLDARRPPASEATGCTGDLGSDAPLPKPLSPEVLDELRKNAYSRQRVGLGALGSPNFLKALGSSSLGDWPSSSAVRDPWPKQDVVAVIDAAAGRTLRLAWRVPDASTALETAASLREIDHPVRDRLSALGGGWNLSTVTASLRPTGACLRADITLERQGRGPSAEEVARVAALSAQEIERALAGGGSDESVASTLLAPTDPQAAAALAAWTAVRGAYAPGPERRVVEYAAPKTDRKRPSSKALATTFETVTQALHARTLPGRHAVEAGQPEMWLLVASPCGTRSETKEEAGLRALAVRSMALGFDGALGVHLEPWATPRGVGIVAHAPRHPGETPQAQAERIARAAGRALAGPSLDGRVVAGARATTADRLGADAGWWLAVETLSTNTPAALLPLGTWESVSTASTSDVERARTGLASGPLQVATLANENAQQAEAARAALGEWLGPYREDESVCPPTRTKTPNPGVWNLDTISEGVREGAYVSVWAPGDRELGHATEFLLNRPGGWLDTALRRPGLVSTARAHWVGGGDHGGLIIEIGAEEGAVEDAVQQTRALLARLAEGAVTPEDAGLAAREQARLEAAAAESPRGRLVQLWHDRAGRRVDLEGLRALHEAFGSEKHLIVRVQRRK